MLATYDGVDVDAPSGTSFKPTSTQPSPILSDDKSHYNSEKKMEYDKIDETDLNKTITTDPLKNTDVNVGINRKTVWPDFNTKQNCYDAVDDSVPTLYQFSGFGETLDIDEEVPAAKKPKLDCQPAEQQTQEYGPEAYESVSSSRQRMAGLVSRVNSIIRRQERGLPIRYETENLTSIENELSHLREVIRYDQESDIASSDHVHSRVGEAADDEYEWSEYSHSVNRAFERIRSNLKRGIALESNHPQTTEDAISSVHLSKESDKDSQKLCYRNVSPYPSDGEVDGSDVLSTRGETPEPGDRRLRKRGNSQ
uniref:Uncharacterized protein n=1 Tax=Ciona savignyi TaxID=51511 RepID=H2ZJE9_CIOSA